MYKSDLLPDIGFRLMLAFGSGGRRRNGYSDQPSSYRAAMVQTCCVMSEGGWNRIEFCCLVESDCELGEDLHSPFVEDTVDYTSRLQRVDPAIAGHRTERMP